ncbi:MAG: PDZ domain-containing protein, partial [Flavobacteriales bacterium]
MFKKLFILPVAALFQGAVAQEAIAQDAPNDRKVRVEIVTTEDGETKRITKEFDVSSEEGIENTLKELGVLDHLNIDRDGENVTIDIRRFGGDEDDDMVLSLKDMIGDGAKSCEPRAFLGVRTSGLTEEIRTEKKISTKQGVFVEAVIDDTPAKKAGLMEGDVITAIDGTSISGPDGLTEAIRSHEPGDEVKVTYERGGKKKTTSVELCQQQNKAYAFEFGPEHGSEAWDWETHMGDAAWTGATHAFLGVTPGDGEAEGAVIGSVEEGTAAEKMGIESGDVITRINEEKITDFSSLSKAIKSQEPGDKVTIALTRSGKEMSLSGELGESEGHRAFQIERDGHGSDGELRRFHFDDESMAPQDREELRREMDELRREMTEMRRELRNDLRTETRITIEKTPMTAEEKALLQRKGVDLKAALDLGNMRVFPNPSNGFYRLQFDVPERGDLNVDVHDATGEKVYEERISNFKGRYERTLD